MEQAEKWLSVIDYPNYEVSNLGRLRNKKGFYFNLKPHKVKGYVEISIENEHGRKNIALHRLVALHFVKNPNPEKYKCVNHKTGIKTDNRATQLEWCSHSENMAHAYKSGLISPTFGAVKLTIEDVIDMKKLMLMDMPHEKIARLYNVTSNQVRNLRKRTWKSLKSIYRLSRLQ